MTSGSLSVREQALGDLDGRALVGQVREQHAELVAAQPGREVVVARSAPRSRSATATRASSPAAWPRRVVDRLEVVEVEEQRRHRSRRRSLGQGRPRGLHEAAPVGQAGQWVVECLELSCALEHSALGDVAGQEHDQADQSGEHEERQQRRAERDHRKSAIGVGTERQERPAR